MLKNFWRQMKNNAIVGLLVLKVSSLSTTTCWLSYTFWSSCICSLVYPLSQTNSWLPLSKSPRLLKGLNAGIRQARRNFSSKFQYGMPPLQISHSWPLAPQPQKFSLTFLRLLKQLTSHKMSWVQPPLSDQQPSISCSSLLFVSQQWMTQRRLTTWVYFWPRHFSQYLHIFGYTSASKCGPQKSLPE